MHGDECVGSTRGWERFGTIPADFHYVAPPMRLTSHAAICQCWYNSSMKRLIWLADTRAHVKKFPDRIRDDIGYALYAAQVGE